MFSTSGMVVAAYLKRAWHAQWILNTHMPPAVCYTRHHLLGIVGPCRQQRQLHSTKPRIPLLSLHYAPTTDPTRPSLWNRLKKKQGPFRDRCFALQCGIQLAMTASGGGKGKWKRKAAGGWGDLRATFRQSSTTTPIVTCAGDRGGAVG